MSVTFFVHAKLHKWAGFADISVVLIELEGEAVFVIEGG